MISFLSIWLHLEYDFVKFYLSLYSLSLSFRERESWPRSCKSRETLFISRLFWLAGEVSWLAEEVLSPCQNKRQDIWNKISLELGADTIITFHHTTSPQETFKCLICRWLNTQVWCIIEIVSSRSTYFHSESLGLISVITYLTTT